MTVALSLLAVVCLIALVDTTFRRFAASRIRDIFENVPPFGVVPAEISPNARQLKIRTQDGLTLAGSLHPPASGKTARGLIIFCPELNGNHWMATHYCHSLLQQEFAVLSFDFRNQGESEHQSDYSPIHWITEYEMRDIAAVLEFVESDEFLSTLPLGMFGVSRGGVAALTAGCRYPKIQAVLADSSFGTMGMTRHYVRRFGQLVIPAGFFTVLPAWHIDITLRQAMRVSERARNCQYVHLEYEAKDQNHTCVQLISGKRDSYVAPVVARALADLFGGEEILWIVSGAKHNMARSVAEEEYDRRVAAHFQSVIGSAGPAGESSSQQPAAARP